ncbi:hypothetical protein [Chryseobacterium pennipullorum]|uniref:hypothetical protein n=1 Tax=Chryseobacterium pennipullorum TaxID=2258963 RepID=UPI000F4F6E91|nr:hypothetical protein [Chryseobacterium pennipullorum]
MKNLNFGYKRSDFLVTNLKDNWFVQSRFYEADRDKPLLIGEDLTSLRMRKNESKSKSCF